MRALGILQKKLNASFDFMHAKRRAAFWRGVEGLLRGQRLWLTALGRSLPGTCADKHRIKAIDRLLGNASIQRSSPMIYAALAGMLLRGIRRPTLLVDWTGADPGFGVLSAKLSFRGRALTLFSRTFPKQLKCSPRAEREFLNALIQVIPANCKPVLVTDAGFSSKWFDAVRACGWDFVGRLRGRVRLSVRESRMTLPDVHELAGRHPRDLGTVFITLNAYEHRVVLSAKPKLKGRRKLGRNGVPRRSTADRQRRTAAREPWVLATSLAEPASVVVQAYGLRMQIEETFRDLKSHRYGWSAEDIRSKDARRIDVLLLIGAYAAVVMHIVGIAAAEKQLDRSLQANTVRHRRVFSSFFLGKLAIVHGHHRKLGLTVVLAAFRRLFQMLAHGSLLPSEYLVGAPA